MEKYVGTLGVQYMEPNAKREGFETLEHESRRKKAISTP